MSIESLPQETPSPSKSTSSETLAWMRARELASLSLLLYGLSLIVLGIGVTIYYGSSIPRLIDAKADVTFIAGAVLMLIGSIITCFVFGSITGFMGFSIVKKPMLQGWKTLVTLLGILILVAIILGVVGVNLIKSVHLSTIMIIAAVLLMITALFATMLKNMFILGILSIASGGVLIPLVTTACILFEDLFSYQYLTTQIPIYLNITAPIALIIIGIALIVKSLNLSKPIHNILIAIGIAVYTLGLILGSTSIVGIAYLTSQTKILFINTRTFIPVEEIVMNITTQLGIIAATILAICGVMAFSSALIMAVLALKSVITKRTS